MVAVMSQALTFALQTGSTIVLARLLSPEDFGLQGMVLAMTGLISLFRDAGLGAATVQRQVLTCEQASTLFWINVAVGAVLMLITMGLAPSVASFYKEPRLLYMTLASATAFLFNGLAVQHASLLYRNMRFLTLARINIVTLALSSALAVSMAAVGAGYWALVGMTISTPIIFAVGVYLSIPWLPGKPSRGSGIRSMLVFGSTVTLNSLVVYLAYNTEKILLGRFWGAGALGLYGRAYQLAYLPVQQLNSSLSTVAFPALASIQDDADRIRRTFLKGYSLVISLTIPATISCALFADEIVGTLLGAKWIDAAVVLRCLAPTVFAFALVNPFGWLLQATGRATRSLYIALMIAPVVLLGILLGLPYGAIGVAIGYSTAMVLLVVPIVAWASHDTGITLRDYLNALQRPVVAGGTAYSTGWVFTAVMSNTVTPLVQLVLGLSITLGVYAWILLVVMGQGQLYTALFVEALRKRPMAAAS